MNAPRRRGLLLAAGLAAWALACAAAAAGPAADGAASTVAAQAGGPDWHWEETTYDLGRAYSGQVLEHTFHFRNTGSRPLTLIDIKPACGCTQTGAFDRNVLPGRSGTIAFRLDTARMQGLNRRSILIRSNAAAQPEQVLWLQVFALTGVTVRPETVDFGVLDPMQPPPARRVQVTVQRLGRVRVLPPAANLAIFRFGWEETHPGREYVLTVQADPSGAAGTFALDIPLRLAGPEPLEPIAVPVRAYVPAAVDVRPQAIILSDGPLPAELERELVVQYYRPGAVTLSHLTANVPGVGTELLGPATGRRFVLAVRFPAGFRVPPAGAQITCTTSEPGQTQLSVPVIAATPDDFPPRVLP